MAFDAGAKRIMLSMASAADISSVPEELSTKFQTSFYAYPVDAVFKALGTTDRRSRRPATDDQIGPLFPRGYQADH